MSEIWGEEKRAAVQSLNDRVQQLVGATIKVATARGHLDDCDGVNQIVLETDKGTFVLTGSYGGYTGNSCDEYYELRRNR